MCAYVTSCLCLLPGILEAGKMIGPISGLLLGSFCARIYVDIVSVNTGNPMHFIFTAWSLESGRMLRNAIALPPLILS